MTPAIDVEQDELDVNKESAHYFNLHRLEELAKVVAVAATVVVAQKQTPSVPWTHPAETPYDPQLLYEIHPVPDVVQEVVAANATHPVCEVILVAVADVASVHNYNLQDPTVAVPVGTT